MAKEDIIGTMKLWGISNFLKLLRGQVKHLGMNRLSGNEDWCCYL